MNFASHNFLYAVKQLVVGSSKKNSDGSSAADGGYNTDFALALGDVSPATGSTTLVTDAAGLHVLKTVHSQTSIGTAGFIIPRDYDQNTDKLILRVTAAMSGGTDTPVLAVTSSTQAVVTSTGSTYGALAAGTIASTAALSTTISIYELDLSNQSLVRDTIVSLVLTSGAHTTNDVLIYALEIVYASCLVAFSDSSNMGGTKIGYDALGNPLR